MFQQILEYIGSVPFFGSVAFGVTAMVIVGGSWCLVGLVMGDAPKKGIDPSLVQLFGALFSTIFSLIIMVATGTYSTATPLATVLTCLAYFSGCVLNFFQLQFMSRAMQSGPNGIVWAIIQSALVFPFIGGILFFDVKFTHLRGIGITLLLAALVLFAFTRNNAPGKTDGKWKLLAFSALALTAIQQNLTTMPSYFEAARGVPSILRAMAASGGTLFTAVLWNLCLMSKERWNTLRRGIASPILWKYIAALQFFNLLFAYTLFYPGMNIMAQAGMGGMCYPMMVGSCIVSFTLTSIWLLKEKVSPAQLAALAVCIAGLILICTR
jgi:multidrug transporter EmrE-like cation transporter